jgi:hypothetical protein
LPRRSEHQADGQVGDFVRQDTRRIGHGHVALARGGEIDAIGSDAEHGNHFELGKRRDQRAIGAAGLFARLPRYQWLYLLLGRL